jgi:hypothetical protein
MAVFHSKSKRSENGTRAKSSLGAIRKSQQRLPQDQPKSRHRLEFVLCGMALLILIYFPLSLSLKRFLDQDELEHLNGAFFMSCGHTMYSTFFENHPPLTAVLLQPIVKICSTPEGMIRLARGFMLAFMLGALLLAAKMAAPVGGLKASLFSAIWLLSNTFYVHKGIEVRPDMPAALCFILGLLLMTRGLSRSGLMLISGILLGIAGLFTPKVIYASAGAVIGMCVAPGDVDRAKKIRICFLRLLLLAAGAAIPAGISALELARHNALSGFVRDAIEASLRMKVDNPAFFRHLFIEMTIRENTVSWILTAIGMAVLFRKRRSLPPGFCNVILCSLLGGIAGLFLIDAPMRQYFLTFLAPAAVAGSAGMVLLGDLAAKGLGRKWAAAGLATLLILMVTWPIPGMYPAQPQTMDQQLRIIQRVIQIASPEDQILDCWTGLYLTRLPAYRYFYLNSDVQRILSPDKLTSDLLEVLDDRKTKVVIRDSYFEQLPRSVLESVQKAYAPDKDFPFLWVRR